MILLGVVASTQRVAEQIGWVGQEGQIVLGNAVLNKSCKKNIVCGYSF